MLSDGMLGVSLLAGSANVIMQLGRPGLGYGVLESRVDSGNLFKHPLKRSRTTVTYLAVAMLGTDDERAAYRRAVNTVHAHVVSTDASPVQYHAFDRDLQLWVAACLYHGVEDVHRAFLGCPAPESWYADAVVLGTTLQVRPEQWPVDRAAFAAYWADGLARVDIDDRLREYLTAIANLEFLPRPWPLLFGRLHRFVTTGFLPEVFREQMRLPWSAADQRRFDRLMRGIGRMVERLPLRARRFPYDACLADFRRRLRAGKPLV
ncbi:oxygenase MpaB family protein [Amycolatopsis jejuensis]|uniref:oxygenase MpaB family protein n=1 Tax=Amycolatopsis jejuensis TaxID=330084 RepID=UPI000524D0E3|nr:oxygenase MpaB family protein [Amycolatopsis jejuensis]